MIFCAISVYYYHYYHHICWMVYPRSASWISLRFSAFLDASLMLLWSLPEAPVKLIHYYRYVGRLTVQPRSMVTWCVLKTLPQTERADMVHNGPSGRPCLQSWWFLSDATHIKIIASMGALRQRHMVWLVWLIYMTVYMTAFRDQGWLPFNWNL